MSTSERPKRLYYTGEGERYAGVPASDLDEAQIARLSDEKLANIMKVPRGARRALYQVSKPSDRQEEEQTPEQQEGAQEPENGSGQE